jgi:hypothetical protein
MATAEDIILGALRFNTAYASGESLAASDASECLETLNDLLDSLSTDQGAVFCSIERIFTFTPGTYQYTIGNYDAGDFAGVVTNGSPTITGVTVPADMVARGDLSGVGIPAGTTILSFNSGAGTVTMSANATLTPGTPLQISYTIPGAFKAPRPLRITQAFTRITTASSGLDYPIEIIDKNKYAAIGYKALSGPWPIAAWYNRTFPLGTLYFYQAPSGSGELHLYCDEILSQLSELTTQVNLPQGYSRYLKRKLSRELAPEYGKDWTQHMEMLAKEAEDYVKSLNMMPVEVSNYDPELCIGPSTDAGWIMHGGFNR